MTESELIGVNDMMLIMFWIRSFLLKQVEGIVVDLLFDNKSPSPWEQNGKNPIWKKDNVSQREVDRNHYGQEVRCKPNGMQVITGEGNV